MKENKNILKNNSVNSGGRKYIVNHAIRAEKIRLLDETGKNLGVVPFSEGIKMANQEGMDLLLISPGEIPTTKIVQLDKIKYNDQLKEKEQNRKQRQATIKIKQVEFRPNTDIHDLQTRAGQATKFLNDGCKVKVVIKFTGREVDHKDLALGKFDTFLELLGCSVSYDQNMNFDGKNFVMVLAKTGDAKAKTA